eukprot:763047-Hanusia_phi.AAC.1
MGRLELRAASLSSSRTCLPALPLRLIWALALVCHAGPALVLPGGARRISCLKLRGGDAAVKGGTRVRAPSVLPKGPNFDALLESEGGFELFKGDEVEKLKSKFCTCNESFVPITQVSLLRSVIKLRRDKFARALMENRQMSESQGEVDEILRQQAPKDKEEDDDDEDDETQAKRDYAGEMERFLQKHASGKRLARGNFGEDSEPDEEDGDEWVAKRVRLQESKEKTSDVKHDEHPNPASKHNSSVDDLLHYNPSLVRSGMQNDNAFSSFAFDDYICWLRLHLASPEATQALPESVLGGSCELLIDENVLHVVVSGMSIAQILRREAKHLIPFMRKHVPPANMRCMLSVTNQGRKREVTVDAWLQGSKSVSVLVLLADARFKVEAAVLKSLINGDIEIHLEKDYYLSRDVEAMVGTFPLVGFSKLFSAKPEAEGGEGPGRSLTDGRWNRVSHAFALR